MLTLALIIYVSGEVWEFPMLSMKACRTFVVNRTLISKMVEPPPYIYCIPVGVRWSVPNPNPPHELIFREYR